MKRQRFEPNALPIQKSPAVGKDLLTILGIGLFLCFLWLPLINILWPLLPDPPNTEKRSLAPRPALIWRTLGDFPKYFEMYFNDHFGGRRWLVRMHHLVHVEWLGISPLKDIQVGKDGWLYLTQDKALADHQGQVRYSQRELETIRQNIRKQVSWLNNRGIPYLILICPDKQSIYPEYCSGQTSPKPPKTRLDQILAYLCPEEKSHFIDVRSELLEAKKIAWVYPRTDSHWTGYGAFIAYRKVMEALAGISPGIQPFSLSDFSLTEKPILGKGDLAEMLSLTERLPDREVRMVPKHPLILNQKKIPTVLIFHDSFIEQIKPFLEPHFERICLQHWGKTVFDYRRVDQERPDFVLLELVERHSPALVRE